VLRYRIRNWRQYNRALINGGRLTVWFDEHAIAAWPNTEPPAGPGAPLLYADLAIDCALVFKSVYHLSLRTAQGFLSLVVELSSILSAKFAAPFATNLIRYDHSTFQQQLFHITKAEAKLKVQSHGVADDFHRKAVILIFCRSGRCVHAVTLTYWVEA
jgi:hypothetical protein